VTGSFYRDYTSVQWKVSCNCTDDALYMFNNPWGLQSIREPEYLQLTSPLRRGLLSFGITNVRSVVEQGFRKAGLQTDDLSKTLAAKLDTPFQTMLVPYSSNQRTMMATLDTNRQSILANQNDHQRALWPVQHIQVAVLSRQNKSRRVAVRTQKQTSSILQTVKRAEASALDASQKTTVSIDNLAADIRQLISLSSGSACAKRSGREIFFLGERQDRIMAYLLPLQDDMKSTIHSLVLQHSDNISSYDAEWLLSEFEHLIGSAAQEKAAGYPRSSAKSSDQWLYPQDTVGYLRNTTKERKPCGSQDFLTYLRTTIMAVLTC
jgi:hypothetical protein